MRFDTANTNGFPEGESTVIFFLEDNQYGYGYTYESEESDAPFRSCMLQDRFTQKEMSNDLDGLIGLENRTMYMGEHGNYKEALLEVINFWSDMGAGEIDQELTVLQAIEKGRSLNLDFIII